MGAQIDVPRRQRLVVVFARNDQDMWPVFAVWRRAFAWRDCSLQVVSLAEEFYQIFHGRSRHQKPDADTVSDKSILIDNVNPQAFPAAHAVACIAHGWCAHTRTVLLLAADAPNKLSEHGLFWVHRHGTDFTACLDHLAGRSVDVSVH